MERVFLGICDEEISKDGITTNWDTNKIGGKPDLIVDNTIPCCKRCNKSQLTLVCQVYAPLGRSPYHRTLYIFACLNKSCWNHSDSWTAIRSQLDDSNTANQISQENITQETKKESCMVFDDWGVDADDWGSDEDNDAQQETHQDETVDRKKDNIEHTNEDIIPKTTHLHADNSHSGERNELSSSLINDTQNKPIMCDSTKPSDVDNVYDELGVKTSQICIDDVSGIECESDVNGSEFGTQSSYAEIVKHCIPEDDRITTHSKKTELQYYVKSKESEDKNSDSDVNTVGSDVCEKQNDFIPYFVNVIEQPQGGASGMDVGLDHEKMLLCEYASREGIDVSDIVNTERSGSSASGGSENYEKTSVKHGDKTFHSFTKTVALCPQQILRYEYRGTPVYITQPPSTLSVPSCEYCGKSRQYEMQLMPGLVNVLHVKQTKDCMLEFGTVLIYTCSDSCWTDHNPHNKTEYVFVQPDPDQHLYKS